MYPTHLLLHSWYLFASLATYVVYFDMLVHILNINVYIYIIHYFLYIVLICCYIFVLLVVFYCFNNLFFKRLAQKFSPFCFVYCSPFWHHFSKPSTLSLFLFLSFHLSVTSHSFHLFHRPIRGHGFTASLWRHRCSLAPHE